MCKGREGEKGNVLEDIGDRILLLLFFVVVVVFAVHLNAN